MEEIDINAKIIWDYMLMHQELEKADVIVALGSNDIRVADTAYQVYKQGFAPVIFCTGGVAHVGDINATGWDKAEAEVYKERLVSLGVPDTNIITENEAKNTGDNASLLRKYIQDNNLPWKSFIIVCKPFMERRAYATFKKQYPEAEIKVTSQNISYEDFMNTANVSKDVFINVMVGDLERIKEYPKLGFQIEQDIPEDVWQALEELTKLGFTKYKLK